MKVLVLVLAFAWRLDERIDRWFVVAEARRVLRRTGRSPAA